ncbi:MAG: helix-turn-helix domain-containing protein [Bacilli bacterium]|jgi:transcriptional regulator with XRE-family HTH domain
MKPFRQTVGDNLAALRKEKKITQFELAEKFNYSDKAISKWETGETLPDLETLYQLCEFYGVTLDYLTDPEAEQKRAKYQKSSVKNSLAITLLITSVVPMIATIVFVYLLVTNDLIYWPVFVWMVPVCCLVLVFMNRYFYRSRLFNLIIYSVFLWGLLTSVVVTIYMSATNQVIWPIFLIGIPMQVSIVLWYLTKKRK